ncbi:MAG TPA: hypothetical protein VJ672_10855 [Gemmatimonadaceae bacterium]|nr:hypothetical protein [Gemmatimonadaceae bacterium]
MSWRGILVCAFGACVLLASCGNDDADGDRRARGNGGPPRIAYRPYTVLDGGRIMGSLALAPQLSIDSAPAQDLCGVFPRRARPSPATEARAVVWLADVHSGKPIPIAKRFTVKTDHCDLEPRVQATIAGGTLNVLSVDPVEHRTRFVAPGERAVTVITQFDVGQVVPRTDLLSSPGLLEVRCDLHPWSRAWIHVFDHPYFAEVRSDGVFSLDSVPPGDYRLMYWQERTGVRERPVTVRTGETLRIDIDASS